MKNETHFSLGVLDVDVQDAFIFLIYLHSAKHGLHSFQSLASKFVGWKGITCMVGPGRHVNTLA